ncbi:MAG: hypothetical protein EAZ95_08525 [Bacteroidetes bacterium]|nr:MAG: hypothetical protein EAZ95_08525 [Bacteroidota bacterium]
MPANANNCAVKGFVFLFFAVFLLQKQCACLYLGEPLKLPKCRQGSTRTFGCFFFFFLFRKIGLDFVF